MEFKQGMAELLTSYQSIQQQHRQKDVHTTGGRNHFYSSGLQQQRSDRLPGIPDPLQLADPLQWRQGSPVWVQADRYSRLSLTENGDGIIDKDEIIEHLQHTNEILSYSLVSDMISEIDTNKDGGVRHSCNSKISFQELKNFVRKQSAPEGV